MSSFLWVQQTVQTILVKWSQNTYSGSKSQNLINAWLGIKLWINGGGSRTSGGQIKIPPRGSLLMAAQHCDGRRWARSKKCITTLNAAYCPCKETNMYNYAQTHRRTTMHKHINTLTISKFRWTEHREADIGRIGRQSVNIELWFIVEIRSRPAPPS